VFHIIALYSTSWPCTLVRYTAVLLQGWLQALLWTVSSITSNISSCYCTHLHHPLRSRLSCILPFTSTFSPSISWSCSTHSSPTNFRPPSQSSICAGPSFYIRQSCQPCTSRFTHSIQANRPCNTRHASTLPWFCCHTIFHCSLPYYREPSVQPYSSRGFTSDTCHTSLSYSWWHNFFVNTAW